MSTHLGKIDFLEAPTVNGQSILSPIIQVVTGSITGTSSNATIPFDATTPLNTEGFQIWSQSFTPIRADSTILVFTGSFFVVNANSDANVTGAIFSDTTCISAQLLGWTTDTGEGNTFMLMASHTAGSTSARTYSFRIGPNIAVTVSVAQGLSGQNYGSNTNSGRFLIAEIAPLA